MMRGLVVAGLATASLLAVTAGASASEVTVRIGDRVEPSAVTVPVGGTVTWHNADGERHRVRSTTGPERFDSGNLEPSQTWSWTFSVAGVHPYIDARDGDDGAYQGSVTVTEASAGAGTDAPGAVTGGADGGGPISMRDRSFTPAAVVVPAGTAVTWTNDSDRDHTVTADDGSFDSGTLPPGAQFTHTFDRAGSYGYFCALHGGMRGTVAVGDGQDGGSGGPGDASPPATGAMPATSGPDSAPSQADDPGGDIEVEVHDFAFAPDAVEVQPGTTVTWRQVGEVPHTVTADGGAFDSGTLPGGETFSHTFTGAGTYRYVCALHPQMVAAVTVAGGAGDGEPAPVAAAPSLRTADAGLVASLLLLGFLLAASVLLAAWRIERALRRLASPGVPPAARRPPART